MKSVKDTPFLTLHVQALRFVSFGVLLLGPLSASCVCVNRRVCVCGSNLAWLFSCLVQRDALNLLCLAHRVLVFSYRQPPFNVSRAALFFFFFFFQPAPFWGEQNAFLYLFVNRVGALVYRSLCKVLPIFFLSIYYFRCKSAVSSLLLSAFSY